MPVFNKQFYSDSVPENIELHSPLSVAIQAESPLGRKLIYSIVKGNELELFAVDFNTGMLIFCLLFSHTIFLQFLVAFCSRTCYAIWHNYKFSLNIRTVALHRDGLMNKRCNKSGDGLNLSKHNLVVYLAKASKWKLILYKRVQFYICIIVIYIKLV